MSTLPEFLLARIAEDEAAAKGALIEADYIQFGDTAAEALLGLAESEGAQDAAIAHFQRHDPARVLAECEAKRQIVALHGGEHVCWQPDYPVDGDFGETTRRGDCATLRYLAAVYAEHPDYRPEWRP